MRFPILVVFFSCAMAANAQKPPLDFSTQTIWPFIKAERISNDGKYLSYEIDQESVGKTLIIQPIDGSWKREILHSYNALFTEDNKNIIFTKSEDSIGVLELKSNSLRYIEHAMGVKIPSGGSGEWLAYQLKQPINCLVVLDLFSWKEERYSDIIDYEFSSKGHILLLQALNKIDTIKPFSLLCLNLDKGSCKTIYSGNEATHFSFDDNETQLAFLTNRIGKRQFITSLQHYRLDMDSSENLIDSTTLGMKGMILSRKDISFNTDGTMIFFCTEKKKENKEIVISNPGKVEMYRYQDDTIPFEKRTGPFLSVIHLNSNKKVIRLQQDNDGHWHQLNKGNNEDFILFESNVYGSRDEYKWRIYARPDIILVSTKDGSRRLVTKRLVGSLFGFSPGGKYINWYDRNEKSWFCYNLTTTSTKNISLSIKLPIYRDEDHPDLPLEEGIAGWTKDDQQLLIYDRFDIWKLDPESKKPPINITHGFGRLHQIQLRYMDFNRTHQMPLNQSDTVFLSGFSISLKLNGFFKLVINGDNMLTKLILEPRVYYFPYTYAKPDFPSMSFNFFPIKAKNANIFIVKRMTSFEYPNLYVTSDFKNFRALTTLAPQNAYNWYKSELVHWSLGKPGKLAEGILYKPENFDPTKKYPLIFYYYEKSTDALNAFINPSLSNGSMNIPWFVSNGYLVFVPDIYYRNGYPGESAYISVVSAARYLSKKPWVDSLHMGLQGHSFGGFETDYIVTRTKMFAAAAPAAGTSNLISAYNRFGGWWGGTQWFYEVTQGRIGVPLWEKPELYIKNSAIFKADKVTTPILIMHNKGDDIVLFDQEAEWFSGLDRLRKKVWLLSYDGEGHTIDTEENQLDYSIKLSQFFGHYLKGYPMPKWMTEINIIR